MVELLTDVGLSTTPVLIGLVLSAAVMFLLYRKHFVALIEPLAFFAIEQVGDATIMFALPVITIYKWKLFAYMVSLWAGFAFRIKSPEPSSRMSFTSTSILDLKVIITILGVLLIGLNLYLGASVGFPLLSGNPTEAKISIYTGGLGLIRRFNMGPYWFFCSGCVLLIVLKKSRRYISYLLAIATLLVMLEGSKSSVLPMLFALSFVISHKGLACAKTLVRTTRTYATLILLVAIGVALTVTIKETRSVLGGLQALLMRFLLAGDIILYYYPQHDMMHFNVNPSLMGYARSMLGDVLGLLRIVAYEKPLGMVILGSDQGGPNVQYFIYADLFFSPVAGCLYSFVVGYAISLLRKSFLESRTRSLVTFCCQLYMALVAFNFAVDAGSFAAASMFTLICVVPLYPLAYLLRGAMRTPKSQLGAAL